MTTTETVKLAVKQLEWHGPDFEGEYWAASIAEKYVIYPPNGNGYWLGGVGGYFSSVSAAKAAAQADYEARILSAIAIPAGGEVEPVAWACKTCNSPRSIDPCPKCGTPLTKPADGWDWPTLPDIDRIRALAREVGYAVGVHGSLERDLDLIAAPWVAEAVEPMALAEHIAAGLGGRVVDYERQDKPCGRWSCNIHTPDWTKMIDLSVMPPAAPNPAPSGEAVPVAWRYRVSPNQINWNYWGDSERPIGRPSGVDIVIAEPLYAAPPQGVEITEAMVQVGRRAILKCRFYDPEPHMYDSEAAFFAHIETTDHWPEAEDEARNALTAALSPTGRDAE